MKRLLNLTKHLLLLLTCLLVLSCTVKQELNLNTDGSGTVKLHVELMSGFYDYIVEMQKEAGDLGYGDTEAVFDLNKIRDRMAELPGVTVVKLTSASKNVLDLVFNFEDINLLIAETKSYFVEQHGPDTKVPDVLTYKVNGKQYTLDFRLTGENLEQILPLIPIAENPLFEALGPQPDDPISEAEYYDLVEFTIGKHGPDMVKKSFIHTTITVNGQVVSQSGGRITGKTVEYSLPLINFILLLKPIQYSLTFK